MNQAQVHAQVFLSAREMVHVRVRSLVSRAVDSQVLGGVVFETHTCIAKLDWEQIYGAVRVPIWEQVQDAVRVPIWDEAHEYVRGRA